MRKLAPLLFTLLFSFSASSQECDAGAGVLLYYSDGEEIYLLLADHIKPKSHKKRGWSSFGGECNGSIKNTAFEELKEETKGYYSFEKLKNSIQEKDTIHHVTKKKKAFVTFLVKVDKPFNSKELGNADSLSNATKHNERDPYHVFKLSQLIDVIKNTPSGPVNLHQNFSIPSKRKDGSETQKKLYDEFVVVLNKALDTYKPFVDFKKGLKKEGGVTPNIPSTIDVQTSNSESIPTVDNRNETIYKKIVIRKDGFVLSKIPQYDYREPIFIEIDGLKDPKEAMKFSLGYKHLEEFDQPFAINSPDGILSPTKIGGSYYFEIPSFSKNFRKRHGVGKLHSYEKSKNREAFVTYNIIRANSGDTQCDGDVNVCVKNIDNEILELQGNLKTSKEKKQGLSKSLNQKKIDTAKNDPVMVVLTKQIDSLSIEVKKVEIDIKILKEKIVIANDKIELFKATSYEPAASAALETAYNELKNLKVDSLKKELEKFQLTTIKSAKSGQKTGRKGDLDEIVDNTDDGKEEKKLIKQIDEGNGKVRALKSKKKKLEAHAEYQVVKVGGIVLGNNSKTIAYELGYRTKSEGKGILDLKRMGNFPVMTEEDHLYASIINRIGYKKGSKRLEGQNYNLRMSLTEIDSPEYIPSPIRPSSTLPSGWEWNSGRENETRSSKQRKIGLADSVYQDLILPMGKNFRRGRVLKVAFNADSYTFEDDETTDPKKKGFKLEDKKLLEEKYPQIRGLYRFNLTTGLVGSFITRCSFTKVRNTNSPDDNPTYFIRESANSDPRVFPIVALTVYWKPVDYRSKARWTEMIPNPMVAFDFRDPTSEIFIGASSEFVRNMQLLYGIHYSKVDNLAPSQNLRTDADPIIEQSFEPGFFIGLSFNFNLVTNFYKDSFKKPDGNN